MQILKRGKSYAFVNHVQIDSKLETLNYEYGTDAFGAPLLNEIDPIKLPSKIYSNDKVFIEHVKNSWAKSQENIGICLVGEKGLGKSLTSNILAKEANVPVIRITSSLYGDAAFKFLNEIEQDFVLIIDEFEKLFDHSSSFDNGEKKMENAITQEDFLSFLDGGSLRNNKIMFIITSNNAYKISSFLKNRPSRLKYFKEYKNMDDEIIKEIVADLLEDPQFSDDLLENIPYEGLNTDVLIQVIKEINTHKIPYTKFKDFFNFKEEGKSNYELFIPDANGKNYTNIAKVQSSRYYSGQNMAAKSGKYYRLNQSELWLKDSDMIENITIDEFGTKGELIRSIKNCYFKKETFETISSRVFAAI